jgi:hypothetical protein
MKAMASHHPFRIFGFSVLATVGTLVAVLLGMGWGALAVTMLLVVIELSFSFDNAIINAKVLATMSKRWQMIFLTVGILIAIFGMRVIFPVLIVSLGAHLSFGQVIDLALHHPHEYAEKLEATHPTIASFGGAFLLMLSFQFFFDRKRDVHWFTRLERFLQRLQRKGLASLLTLATVVILAFLPANPHTAETLEAGVLGIVIFVVIQSLVDGLEALQQKREGGGKDKIRKLRTGWAAFSTFLYLEILDASFSFDGVLGAFAVTTSVVLIAAGLGVGALWVRSLTVFMVRRGTLDTYKFLEHGAHYTIVILAASLLLSVFLEVPEVVSGLAGLVFIGGSIWASRRLIARTAAK